MNLSLFLYFAAVAVGLGVLVRFTIKAESTSLFNRTSRLPDNRSQHTDDHLPRTREQVLVDVKQGVKTGLSYATGFSVLAGIAILLAVPRGVPEDGGEVLGFAVLFYIVFGALAGVVYGLLRPIRHRLWGRLIIAYSILLLVYGGGSLALRPLLDPRHSVPMRWLIGFWCIVCLVLTPVYAFMFRPPRSG